LDAVDNDDPARACLSILERVVTCQAAPITGGIAAKISLVWRRRKGIAAYAPCDRNVSGRQTPY